MAENTPPTPKAERSPNELPDLAEVGNLKSLPKGNDNNWAADALVKTTVEQVGALNRDGLLCSLTVQDVRDSVSLSCAKTVGSNNCVDEKPSGWDYGRTYKLAGSSRQHGG